MKIAAVSDTHGNVANFRKAMDWINKEGISVVLHCGDIGSLESLKESLAGFGVKFFGVLGNMDKDFSAYGGPAEGWKTKQYNIKEKVLDVEFDGKKIAITHFPDAAKKLAQSGKFDLVFYGHTHRPWDEKVGGCRMINPGELAGQFYKPSFAVYDTSNGNLELKILEKL